MRSTCRHIVIPVDGKKIEIVEPFYYLLQYIIHLYNVLEKPLHYAHYAVHYEVHCYLSQSELAPIPQQ